MSRNLVMGAMSAGHGAFILEATARRMMVLAAARGQQQQRCFTSTPSNNVQITQFTPTSSPDLDRLLDEIRYKIILPAFLPETQRKHIYSRKWEKKLKADPVTIEIDGEVIKFRYQDCMTDLPNTRKSVSEAILKFETDADFANLRPLLDGIAYTERRLPPGFYVQILRHAASKGRIFDIIDCARNVRHTKYKLDRSERVNELLHYVQLRARDADWDESKTRQALRWAEMVVELLQDDGHQLDRPANEVPLPGELPLHRDPMILAAPLHLAAVIVARLDAGLYEPPQRDAGDEGAEGVEAVEKAEGAETTEGVEGAKKIEGQSDKWPDKWVEGIHRLSRDDLVAKVRTLARDIVALWPEGKGLKEVQPAELYEDRQKLLYLRKYSKFISLTIPLLHGLETAIKVVGIPELENQLRVRHDKLATEIQEDRNRLAVQYEEMNKKNRRRPAEAGAGSENKMNRDLKATRAEVTYKKFYGS